MVPHSPKPAKSRDAIAEVLSSTITSVIAQTNPQQELDISLRPRFGSFLTVATNDSDIRIFAVVYNVVTGAPDSVHKPVAMGLTRDELRAEQPHIFSLLRTEIHAAIVGYEQNGNIFQHLPPHPPDVHDFVYLSTQDEIIELTADFDFLRLLLHVSAVPADELLAATVREAQRAAAYPEPFLVAAGQALSKLLQNDYDRLVALLRKIRPQQAQRSGK
ncbi:MAG TPA: hypothetical protein V6C86_01290 [Oculatellaceae cyanobacterium]